MGLAGSDWVGLSLAGSSGRALADFSRRSLFNTTSLIFLNVFFLQITRKLQVLAFLADGSRFYAHVVIAVSPRAGGVLAGLSLEHTGAELGSFGRRKQ